jgi:hypothetical protein
MHAATRAQQYHRFNAQAVRRILERDHPLAETPPITPVSEAARAVALLTEVEPCSLEPYRHLDIDSVATSPDADSSAIDNPDAKNTEEEDHDT